MAGTATETAPSDTLNERQLLAALRAVRKGDFSVRLPSDRTGIAGEIAEAFNDIVDEIVALFDYAYERIPGWRELSTGEIEKAKEFRAEYVHSSASGFYVIAGVMCAARLAGIRLSAITNVNTVVDCARISCATGTLGGAAALTPSAIRPNATLSALVGAFGNVTINDIIIGILPRSALAWESFPLDGLQLYAGTGDEVVFNGVTLRVEAVEGLAIERIALTFEPPEG